MKAALVTAEKAAKQMEERYEYLKTHAKNQIERFVYGSFLFTLLFQNLIYNNEITFFLGSVLKGIFPKSKFYE